MAKINITDTIEDYNQVNSDYTGERNLQNDQELVQFQSKSLFRVWMNDLDVSYSAHWHSAIEIIMPIDSWYDACISGKQYHVTPDDILFIPSGALHELHAPDHGLRFIFLLDISTITELKGFAEIQAILSQPIMFSSSANPAIFDDIYRILVQIRNEYFNQTNFSELSIQSLLLSLFVKIGENQNHTNELFSSVRPNKQKEYVQRFNQALEYINKHYMEDISQEFLASEIGFSKYHFSRLFKQYTNYTFCDYLCFRRMKAAEEMLESPDYSITEVAINSGFPSISTFNRLFKQQKGCTPSEYRRQNRGLQAALSIPDNMV